MTQVTRPMTDVSNSGWGVIPAASPGEANPLSNRLNEVNPDDTTLVVTVTPPQGNTFEVKFAPLAQPATNRHTLTVRLQKTDPANVPVLVKLLQGGLAIATTTVVPTQAFANATLVLTAAQIAQITDYTDLRLRVTAGYPASGSAGSGSQGSVSGSRSGGTVNTACCSGVPLPTTLHATVSGQTGNCNIQSFTLTYSAASQGWVGTDNNNQPWSLHCTGSSCGNFVLANDGYFLSGPVTPQPGCTCNPLSLVFHVAMGSGPYPCAGSATITVTT